MTTKQTCSISVPEPGPFGNFHLHPCTKPAKVKRDGKLYCTIHDPDHIKAKEGAKCFHRSHGGYGPRCGQPSVAIEHGFGVCAAHTRENLRAKERLTAAAPDLLEAARLALAHILDLEEAWLYGAISDHAGKGATRSNRNHDVRVALSAAIAKAGGL